jgi:hypothetical protein
MLHVMLRVRPLLHLDTATLGDASRSSMRGAVTLSAVSSCLMGMARRPLWKYVRLDVCLLCFKEQGPRTLSFEPRFRRNFLDGASRGS